MLQADEDHGLDEIPERNLLDPRDLYQVREGATDRADDLRLLRGLDE